MERSGVIFIVPVMILKCILSPEEVVIVFRILLRIPCHIDIIVEVTYAYDIPGMILLHQVPL